MDNYRFTVNNYNILLRNIDLLTINDIKLNTNKMLLECESYDGNNIRIKKSEFYNIDRTFISEIYKKEIIRMKLKIKYN